MKQELVKRMEYLRKELRQIENDLDVQFTSVDGDFHFFVLNLEMHIEKRFVGKFDSEIVMPIDIFECACDWYAKKISENEKVDGNPTKK